MTKLNIDLSERSYPIYITTDYLGLSKCVSSAKLSGRIVLITDSNVDGIQAGECLKSLEESGIEVVKYVFEAGEKNKNLDTVRDIYKFLVDMKLDRGSTLMALGGGVVGDITGFAAATFLRGINFVQIPTTLLAQADSSVGGKVGVDFEGGKNLIGAFYQPRFVYINVNSLKTLPSREFKSGMAEVIKHGFILDADFLDYLSYNSVKILNHDENCLQYLAKTNCSIKGSVVEKDEKESGLRAILNFGHTMGHAIESVSDFRLLHGECVAAGMTGAFLLAQKMGMIDEAVVNKAVDIMEKYGIKSRVESLDADKVYDQMFLDKKLKKNKLHFILPRKIGEVVELAIDDKELIREVLREIII